MTVLNCDDADWFWVSRFDGRDGFVPSGFIYPLDAIQRQREFWADCKSNSISFLLSFYQIILVCGQDTDNF